MMQKVAAAEASVVKAQNHMVHRCNAMPSFIQYQPPAPSFSCTISDANAKASCDVKKQAYNRALNAMKVKAKAEFNSAMAAKQQCDVATKAHADSTTRVATLKTQWANHQCKDAGKGKPQIGEQNVGGGPDGPLGPRPPSRPTIRRRRATPKSRRRRNAPTSRRRRAPAPVVAQAVHPKAWCKSNNNNFGGYCRKGGFKTPEECYRINIRGTVAIQFRGGGCDFYRLNGAAPRDCPRGFHAGRGTTTKGYKTVATHYGGVHCKLLR